ncbi:hypothetical protein J3R82DRAFT_3293 [Butyriboletus roseoflavus]|nr:hypothetical protein J3R82DRAFT_3293 [Butyriboletus roseoflavus]
MAPPSPAQSLPPPPPPPKDIVFPQTTDTDPPRGVMKPLPIPQHDHVIHHAMSSTDDHLHYPAASTPPPQAPTRVILQGRVDLSPRLRLSPEERLKRRVSAQRRREREEQEALREEQEHQARRRREKEESEQRAREDEERRKAILRDQLRQAAARKEREEREAQSTEERRLHEIKERKQMAHERRLQYTREMQKWRREQIRRAESESSEKEEERKRLAEDRRSRIARLSEVVLQDGSTEVFNGWVTIQTPDHLAWKRRYFMFDLAHSQLSLCKNQRVSRTYLPLPVYAHILTSVLRLSQDSTRSVDLVHLEGRVESLNEWYEGFEELEAIPHSLAVKFVDGPTWLMYADTEQDKARSAFSRLVDAPSHSHIQDRLLVLLSEAAGIII